MTTDLILGTAGHIDHGKTSLIRALTGVDTDRLPEEKRRGITIELGFAELVLGDYRLGIVDVPGHERFVRNMLTGATGMDLAMLVIAADDSVKQQTREHLDILRLLNLAAGVIVITKCDLVEPDWLELVEDEVRELVKDSFLAQAPMVRTSVTTGLGLEELRSALYQAAEHVAQHLPAGRLAGPFRMAIDRTFTIAGHGTVVTGSVSSGRARVGDELVIEPGGFAVRVRSLQNHDRAVEEVHRGQRAAINLAGIHHDEIQRGQELASSGHLRPSRVLTTRISLLETTPRPLKDRERVRIHVGAAELLGVVRLLEHERLAPGHSGLAQLFLNEPCVVTWNQPFVVRSESPVHTIGGGRVLDADAERLRRPDATTLELLRQLESPDPLLRANASLYFAGWRDWKPQDLARAAGIEHPDEMLVKLQESGDLQEFALSPTRRLRIHRLVFRHLAERLQAALERLHESQPLRTMLDRAQLASAFQYLGSDAILQQTLEVMRNEGRVKLTDKGVALVGHGPKLSQNEQKLLVQLIETHRQAGTQPPSIKQCQEQAARLQDVVPQLLALAAANGELVPICSEFYLHADVEREARQRLEIELAAGSGLTMSEIREVLKTSRKYAVPFCEYLDRIGFTERRGDFRVRRLSTMNRVTG